QNLQSDVIKLKRGVPNLLRIERRRMHSRPVRPWLPCPAQSYALYPHLTVAENMAVPLRMRRLRTHQRWPLVGRLISGARRVEQSIAAEVRRTAELPDSPHLLARRSRSCTAAWRRSLSTPAGFSAAARLPAVR